jgi:hypothetical protein
LLESYWEGKKEVDVSAAMRSALLWEVAVQTI